MSLNFLLDYDKSFFSIFFKIGILMKNKGIDYLNRYIDKSFLVFMSLNFLPILHFLLY